MFKKVLPLVFMSGLVLAACNNNGDNGNNGNNGAVPNNNETPMENLEDRTRDWTPDVNNNDVNNNGQTGPNLDGIDNGNDNRVRDGIINDTDMNNGLDTGDTTTTPRDNVKDDLNNNRKNNMNGTNNR